MVWDPTSFVLYLANYRDDEGARIIPLFPGLRKICFPGMWAESFEALARHCPQLVQVGADRAAQTWFQEDAFEDVPPPMISLLLESCPELKSIDCPDQVIHTRHVMNGRPWVCKNLEFIRCHFVGVPKFYDWSMDEVDRMRNRWPEISEEERATLTDQEREILVALDRRELCRQAMEKQFCHVHEIKERELFGDNYLDVTFLPDDVQRFKEHGLRFYS